jgi:hypothetical protein
MNLTAFFGSAFFVSLFIHFVIVQPAWVMIAWSIFTGAGFVFSIVTTSRKGNKVAGKTSYNSASR